MSRIRPDEEYERPEGRRTATREAGRMSELTAELFLVPPEELAELELDPELHDAIVKAHEISAWAARQRQERWVARLLRDREPEVILAALTRHKNRDARQKVEDGRVAKWQLRLVSEGDSAFEALLAQFPRMDRTQLRNLVRASVKKAKTPDAATHRDLTLFLKALWDGLR